MNQIDKTTQELLSYFPNEEQFPSSIILFGQKSTRSLSLQNFLLKLKSEKVLSVVCTNGCYNSKILFETIINTFHDHQLSEENNFSPFACIDTIEDFLSELSSLDLDKSYVIAIEDAGRLRDMELNIITVFTKLQEMTGLNISCIFVSHIPLSKFGVTMPKVYAQDVSKEELIELLSSKYLDIQQKIMDSVRNNQEFNEEEMEKQLSMINKLDVDFYKNFLSIFLNVFYKMCRDSNELQYHINECYPAYYGPILKGEISINDATNLWRNITKKMKVLLKNSHIRIKNLPVTDNSSKSFQDSPAEPTEETSIRTFAQTLELPFYAKYLLIASFLASHNDAKFDKRFFMKHHGKERKRYQPAKVSEKLNIKFGPKSFTMDRLLAIFYAILEEKVGLTCNLLSQISTLVDLNFLAFVSGENNIMEGNARLQSTIGLDFAINIGKVVGFNVKQFLCDFY